MSVKDQRYNSPWKDILDDMAMGLDYFSPPKYTFLQGELYNPETHDLIPKKSFIETQIKLKERQLEEMKLSWENERKAHESREKSLKTEIDTLKQKL